MNALSFKSEVSDKAIRNCTLAAIKRWKVDNEYKKIDLSIEMTEIAFNVMVSILFGPEFIYQDIEYDFHGKTHKGCYGELIKITTEHFFGR